MATIRHIAIFSDNPAELAKFYVDVYGMRITGTSQGDVWVTDGYMDVNLIYRAQPNFPKKGIHHWGFTLEPGEKEAVYAKLKKYGIKPEDPRADNLKVDRPFVEEKATDPDGNRYDLSSTGKREMADEVAQRDTKYAKYAGNEPRVGE